jgi:hypothetical protein
MTSACYHTKRLVELGSLELLLGLATNRGPINLSLWSS